MKIKNRVLIIGFVWPEPNSSASGLRMMQLIDVFIENDCEVIFASSAVKSEYAFDLSLKNVESVKIVLNSDTFDDLVQQINPSVVVFDRFMIEEQFGWRVAKNCPTAIRILDTEDLHSLRATRAKAFKEKRIFDFEDMFSEDITKREIASILRCDMTLLISDVEVEILESFFKVDKDLLYYLPIFYEMDKVLVSKWKGFGERKDFMFIGNFLHEPNWRAVQYLKECIWPNIKRRIPEAVLKIYGAYSSQKVFQLHNEKDGFLIMGRAKSAYEVFVEARVVLAPIQFGAGIKGKLLEAMQAGTPSVTTCIGAEGINDGLEWNGYIANDVNEFVKNAVLLYTDQQIWHNAQKKGLIILEERFQKESFEESFFDDLVRLKQELKSHRAKNFIGALLQHHTLRSTEYMSRWIQEKNKTK